MNEEEVQEVVEEEKVVEDETETDEENEQTSDITETINDETQDIEDNPFFDLEVENETVLLLDNGEEGTELIQSILDVTFTDIFPYLVPLFFLFTVFLFSDQIIALIQNAIGANDGRRRR